MDLGQSQVEILSEKLTLWHNDNLITHELSRMAKCKKGAHVWFNFVPTNIAHEVWTPSWFTSIK